MIWSDLVVRLQQCVGNLCSSPDGGAVGSPAVCGWVRDNSMLCSVSTEDDALLCFAWTLFSSAVARWFGGFIQTEAGTNTL